ncbi:VOC family protein [Nocardioides sp. JQ2195]|uniref:VOC family protein n=1 Tax=Nocardioides sp. JQ2195 TaxID=2592334 RepID=UPI00143E409D|nr:VOC family protein [Nocardioides sp. JQ2195]QIX27799.1 VOC family protein [Nocardioides sp. JQ2195]
MTTPFWISAFLDLPTASFAPAVSFWREVTGYDLSSPRGDDREFGTLLPPDGDDFLRVQQLRDGEPGIHLDLHVTDPRASADRAVALGAEEVADRGHVVMRSPGGFAFCFVTHPASTPPTAATWPDGSTSQVDQVCLDIPSGSYDEECAFWEAVTGWQLLGPTTSPEFTSLRRPAAIPLRLLLQRLGDQSGTVRGHLDLASDDRQSEVRRHTTLGAQLLEEYGEWTVLRDPAGSAYCITDRRPRD